MTNKRRQMARALSDKTGMKYQAAINALAAGASAKQEVAKPTRTLEQLLSALNTTETFAVKVDRVPAVGQSANLQLAQAQSRRLADTPQFFAETGQAQIIVTPSEMKILVDAGAARPDLQVIRSFKHRFQFTFSAHCFTCERWIWCGEDEHAATCFCGFGYRVVFDAPPEWSLPRDMRCMDCGAEFRLAAKSLGVSPWRPINEWQMRCAHCSEFAAHNGSMHVETDEQGKPIVRYEHHDRLAVDKFITENNLRADWSKAFMSSSGTLNGRRLEFWRVPVTSRAPDAGALERVIARHQRLCAAEMVINGIGACDNPTAVVLVTDRPVQFKMSDMLGPQIGTSDRFNACRQHADRMAQALSREQQGVAPRRFKL
jgi:hypothetical protein